MSVSLRRFGGVAAIFLCGAAAPAQDVAPDVAEAGSVESIAKFTTEPRFSSAWVSYVPDLRDRAFADEVPRPRRGRARGALAHEPDLRLLPRAGRGHAPRQGRRHRQVRGGPRDPSRRHRGRRRASTSLDRLKAATADLADPRKTTPEAAEKIIATARPIYYFNAGLHSTETGSPEMVMELAYRLAVSEQPMIQDIRKNLIVLINPVSEPDGRDKAVDWFYRYLKGKTDYDNLPERTPPYWGYYVFHDNNRDTHQKALKLTQAVHGMFYDYHPTGRARSARVDPAPPHLERHRALQREPRPDRDQRVARDVFPRGPDARRPSACRASGPGDSASRGDCTTSTRSPRTTTRWAAATRPSGTPRRRPSSARSARPSSATSTSPSRTGSGTAPGRPTRSSSGRSATTRTTCRAAVSPSSTGPRRTRRTMLRNFYRKGYNSWQKGVKGNPYAFVIPQDQGDRLRVAQMVEVLRGHRIEVGAAHASRSRSRKGASRRATTS